MILYNLFPLLAGPFSQWKSHLTRAAGMGFDWIFVNPIQLLGASRSLYSIADYFRVNPVFLDASAISPEDQIRQVTMQARACGLKTMIDLVINHCAMDSPLVREHPEWFVRTSDGRIAAASCSSDRKKVVWKDLAQFNHSHTSDPEGLYRHCLGIVEHLISLGFEGFRCDAAYQVPKAFWQRLMHDIRQRHRSLCFVAETLGCTADQTKETARAGFDFVFNSSKYWNFQDWWLIEQYNLVRETAASIGFPESHDTPRLCEELNGNAEGLKQRYLFSALFSTGVMIPMGFEFGMRKPLHVINTTPNDWCEDGIDLRSFITQVNAIKKRFPVFHEESPTNILTCHNPNIFLMWKASIKHRDEALLILNKDIWNYQEFYADHLRHFIQAGAPLKDVSPEYRLEYIHEPFHYALRPGQGIVLVTSRS
jgi:starch synthase (maltosyl-transferring)